MAEFALQWKKVGFKVRQGFWMTSHSILFDIDVQVQSGLALGLVGPNGAGKTTTLKLGAGLLEPSSGSVFIQGLPASQPQARRTIGILTETPYVYPYLRLKEWLEMLGGFSGLKGKKLQKRIEAVLDLMELNDQSPQMMKTLSKGQLQRAGVCQSLLHEPSILLLDEPMSGLDPYWRHRVQKLLLDFKSKGGTIVFSSHIVSDVERISDEVVLIQKGKVCWSGDLKKMSRNIQNYEAICHIKNGNHPRKIIETATEPVRQPEGNWRLTISVQQKEQLLKAAYEGKIQLDALIPIKDEVEEILFGFNSNRDQAE